MKKFAILRHGRTRSFLYLFFMVVLAGTCSRDALFNNYMIAERVSALGFLLLSALYISSISSCLATLYGTPRVLQSIASESVIPGIGRLSEGKGPNKVPVNALLLISGITLIFIAIGEMNRLATLATMPFLITYGVIEYSYFALCMQFDLNQERLQNYRAHGVPSPTFGASKKPITNGGVDGAVADKANRKGSGSSDGTTPSVDSHGDDTMPERKGRDEEFEQLLEKYNVDEIEAKPKNFYSHICNRWVSLSGFCIKLILMFLINWGYSIFCIAICFGIWWYIGMRSPGSNPGIASEFSFIGYVHGQIARMMGKGPRKNLATEDQMVVTPVHPGVKMKSSQMNDVNTDYANRSSFHQAHNMEQSRFK